MQKSPTPNLLPKINLRDEFLFPPIHQRHMPHTTRQHHRTAISRIVDLIITEGQVELELVAGGLEVDEFGELLLFYFEGLLAFVGLEVAGLGLAH
jgi:hypothetical protein